VIYLTMNTTIQNDVKKMIRDSIVLLPFVHTASAAPATSNLRQQPITVSLRTPSARVQCVSSMMMQNANPLQFPGGADANELTAQ
jgi:hypothetical protein